MKKVFIYMIALISLFVLFGFSNVAEGKGNSYTIREVEDILFDYLIENQIDIKPGTEEYVEYLLLQLLEDKDKKLSEHIEYSNILFYASEYLYQLELHQSGENFTEEFNLEHIYDRTIKEIEVEIEIEEKAQDSFIQFNKKSSTEFTAMSSSYNPTAAVNYAKEYYNKRNPNYKSHSKNCTNFVSQAIHAGGKSEKKPSPVPDGINSTTTHWYNDSYWGCTVNNNCTMRSKESSSWINVVDFYSYWRNNQGHSTVSSGSKTTIINNSRVGDVIQLKNSSGRWFHSVIVTGKRNGTIYISSNTSDYFDKDFKTLSESSYRVIKFS
ncbi:amidase domain-containing protein [Alkalihalobacillus sp. LMS39]|uniref:amidase domain-containing protein n=1 Tax=Alkalihalobacillus sp. LMS39 TaxID=2924032 RepID=UPI001FB310DA|nr:amidase domain-containing protein [Alkalihalobacillus sp. LMS39]UOE94593.1 amidase domain-containing protein [Alkalihalobacillus sp. LMS39]